MPELTFPFADGETWRITCGYADKTGCGHTNNAWNRYALDFQHTSGGAGTQGRPILAAADGVVDIAGWGGENSFGWYVRLDHPNGFETIYAHMEAEPVVEPGQTVERGDVLGGTGCTGRCTGPHIHFVLLHNGPSVPPEPMCGAQGFDDGQVHTGCESPPPLPPEPKGAGEPGDATCDGAADSIDAAVLLQTNAGVLPVPGCPGAADVNWDDALDPLDSALILQSNAGIIPSLWRGSWSSGAPMPTARTEVTSALLGSKIFVIGGFHGSGANSNTVEVYDTATNTWPAGYAPYPHPVDHAVAASALGKVFVFGGYTTFGGRVVSPAAHEYDPATNTWTPLTDLPFPRAAAAAVTANDLIYIFGGVGPNAATPVVYDPWSNSYDLLAPMTAEREHLSAAAIDGLIYVAGGRQNGNQNIDVTEVYDPFWDTWQPAPPLPTPRGGLAASTVESQVHTLGGEDLSPGGSTFPEHEVFSPATGWWKPAPPLPTPRHGLTAQVVGNKLYVIGGGPQPNLSVSNAVEIFSAPERLSPRPALLTSPPIQTRF
jgi:N-acetylneuraminic acid mutarotase